MIRGYSLDAQINRCPSSPWKNGKVQIFIYEKIVNFENVRLQDSLSFCKIQIQFVKLYWGITTVLYPLKEYTYLVRDCMVY